MHFYTWKSTIDLFTNNYSYDINKHLTITKTKTEKQKRQRLLDYLGWRGKCQRWDDNQEGDPPLLIGFSFLFFLFFCFCFCFGACQRVWVRERELVLWLYEKFKLFNNKRSGFWAVWEIVKLTMTISQKGDSEWGGVFWVEYLQLLSCAPFHPGFCFFFKYQSNKYGGNYRVKLFSHCYHELYFGWTLCFNWIWHYLNIYIQCLFYNA